MNADLLDAYQRGKLILFAGAGVSANLELPTWGELTAHVADELGFDPKIFSTYGDYMALAEFYKKKNGSLEQLRRWMDVEWHKSSIDVTKSEIHQLITRGKFWRIYTTNYDRWLEIAHDKFGVEYDKIVRVADLVSITEGRRQIVKLHGDLTDEESIVLDETSYFRRLNFDTPLDIKLRHDSLSNSVLFIGYSLKDINIRLMFYRLTEMWARAVQPSARPKSYLFMQRPNPVAEEILRHWGIEMIPSDEDDPKQALTGFLKELVC